MRLFFLLTALSLLAAVFVSAFGGLMVRHLAWPNLHEIFADRYLRQIIGFTLLQASLSAVLSIALALPLASAVFRQCYSWRHIIKRFCLFTFVLPQILIVFALVNLHGTAGLIGTLLGRLGVEPIAYLYGLGGILLGHLFFNLPLALFICLHRLEEIPIQNWQTAQLLGFAAKQYFRFVEWPAWRGIIAPLFGMIFTLCALSFTIVLTLGGKPKFNTLEVAIYQAVRYDFDLPLAASLGWLQFILCLSAFLPSLWRRRQSFAFALTSGTVRRTVTHIRTHWMVIRFDGRSPMVRLSDFALFAAFFLLVGLPLLTIAIPLSLNVKILSASLFFRALQTSMVIAGLSTLTALGIAWGLIVGAQYYIRQRERILLAGSICFLLPPLLLAAGLFSIFPDAPKILPVIVINALLVMPVLLRILAPRAFQIYDNQRHLTEILGLSAWVRLRHITYPQLKGTLFVALGFALCLCFGDLSAIALFGGESLVTLPFLMLSLLSSYHIDEAFLLAGVILIIYLLIFFSIRRHADT